VLWKIGDGITQFLCVAEIRAANHSANGGPYCDSFIATLYKYKWWGRQTKDSSNLRFPAYAASTSRTNCLGITYNTEGAAYEFGSEIDRGTP